MDVPVLIIISGLPCSGKTTLGKRLAQDLRLPFIYKDGIKEILFDTLGWSDREWSRKLGRATYPLLYYFIEAQLAAGRSHIVESNFANEWATPEFRELQGRYGFQAVQIQCVADGDELVRRFKQRSESGERHPGHVDHLNYAEMQPALLRGRLDHLDIGGMVIEVDTTDFAQVDYAGLCTHIRAILSRTEYST